MKEAAEIATQSVRTLYRAINRGDLRTVKVNGRTRIKDPELRRWLETITAPNDPNRG